MGLETYIASENEVGEDDGLVVIEIDVMGPDAVAESKDTDTLKLPVEETVTPALDSPVIEPEDGVSDMEFADIVELA